MTSILGLMTILIGWSIAYTFIKKMMIKYVVMAFIIGEGKKKR